MTRDLADTVKALSEKAARNLGCSPDPSPDLFAMDVQAIAAVLEPAIRELIAQEREACAKVADSDPNNLRWTAARDIRARGRQILSDQCEATYQDLRCILPAGHIGRHHDRATISTLAWDDPAPRTYTEQELAQATADGLEKAGNLRARFADLAVEMEKHSNDHIHDDGLRGHEAAIEGVCADRINAILNSIPADIAAKVKEREEQLETAAWQEGYDAAKQAYCTDDREKFAQEALDAYKVIQKALAKEHDAKIMREAYLRCAANDSAVGQRSRRRGKVSEIIKINGQTWKAERHYCPVCKWDTLFIPVPNNRATCIEVCTNCKTVGLPTLGERAASKPEGKELAK